LAIGVRHRGWDNAYLDVRPVSSMAPTWASPLAGLGWGCGGLLGSSASELGGVEGSGGAEGLLAGPGVGDGAFGVAVGLALSLVASG
jgi:hypothetical protein